MDYKSVVAIFTLVLAIISYVFYFRDIFAGKTKPHAFSWLIWAILNGIAFAGQLHDKGGVGTLPLGFTAVTMAVIFLVSLKRGEKDIRKFDWFCLIAAGLALIPWLVSNKPLLSIILITIINLLGFMPTIRKVYRKPFQETLITHVISTAKYALILVALAHYTALTVIFPFTVFVADGVLVSVLLIRRRQIQNS